MFILEHAFHPYSIPFALRSNILFVLPVEIDVAVIYDHFSLRATSLQPGSYQICFTQEVALFAGRFVPNSVRAQINLFSNLSQISEIIDRCLIIAKMPSFSLHTWLCLQLFS